MKTGILHTHWLVVTLYLLFILTLTILLLAGRTSLFDKIREKGKIPRMVTETLMLLTGIGLLFITGALGEVWLWVKVALVAASVGLTILGLKKKSVVFMAGSSLVLVYVFGVAETKSLTFQSKKEQVEVKMKEEIKKAEESGKPLDSSQAKAKSLYVTYCGQCHGEDGGLGFSGAKDLKASTLTEGDMIALIRKGKGAMPANPQLKDDEVSLIAGYVMGLRK